MTDKYSDLKKAAEAANDESRPAYEQGAGVRYLMENMTAGAVLALIAENDALRKDAERYRCFRDKAKCWEAREVPGMAPDRMDAFMDEIIAREDGR